MKKLTLITLFAVAFGQMAFAKEASVLTNQDNDESKLCVNAANGTQTIAEIAKQVGISEQSLDRTIKCNGVGITAFADKFSKIKASNVDTITDKNFSLTSLYANDSAELCVLAAAGDMDKLQRVIRSQGMNLKYIVRHQKCNQMSFVDFVNQYGSEKTAKELQTYF